MTTNQTNSSSSNNTLPNNNSYTIFNGTLTESETHIVMLVKDISSVLSMIGSLIIITAYVYLCVTVRCRKKINLNKSYSESEEVEDKEEELGANKHSNLKDRVEKLKMGYGNDLLFCLSLADFFQGVAVFIDTGTFNPGVTDNLCIAQGFIFNFFVVSSVCWTSVIAYSILLGTSIEDVSKVPKYFTYFVIYGVLAPSILSFGPLISKSYGPATAWCWMHTRDPNDNLAWLWSGVIYSFIWTNIIFNLIAVIKSASYFSQRSKEIENERSKEAEFLRSYCTMLRIFPSILVICWIPATIDRIYIYATGTHNVVSSTVQGLFTALQGFFNAIVYSYYYRYLMKRALFCIKEEEDDSQVELKQKIPIDKPKEINSSINENTNDSITAL